MTLRVRDIPPGVKFCLVRNGHKFTMINQHEDLHYLYRVIAHPWHGKKSSLLTEREWTLNGQSYVKPVVRVHS
ncbi:hypothetical protein ACUY4Q_003679 [Phytobacter sp. AG2a]